MGQSLSVIREFPRAVTSSKKRSALLVLVIIFGYLIKKRVEQEKRKKSRSLARNAEGGQEKGGRPTKRVGVDAQFFMQIKKLLPICIPG